MAISYNYLLHLLVDEDGFSEAEAIYAADNCGADWYTEAVESAVDYLENSDYSRDARISVMMYEGFTEEQANYGFDVASGGDC